MICLHGYPLKIYNHRKKKIPEDNGSSNKNISASLYNALHNAILCLYPPLKLAPFGPHTVNVYT